MVRANSINGDPDHFLEYETFGDPKDPCILLVMGLSTQLLAWREPFCKMLVSQGFFVVRFDNRDIGLSRHFDNLGPPPLIRRIIFTALFGRFCNVTTDYTLDDMAQDAFGLLSHLDIKQAHVCGVSMGGMIAQTMAIMEPERVLSMCSIMSTSGAKGLPQGDWAVQKLLITPPKRTKEARIAQNVIVLTAIAHPALGDNLKKFATEAYQRSYHPVGGARQLNAILAQPDRSSDLAKLKMNCCVIHGSGDRLMKPECGAATAKAVGSGCSYVVVKGMGHVIVEKFNKFVTDAIVHNIRRESSKGTGVQDVDVEVSMSKKLV